MVRPARSLDPPTALSDDPTLLESWLYSLYPLRSDIGPGYTLGPISLSFRDVSGSNFFIVIMLRKILDHYGS